MENVFQPSSSSNKDHGQMLKVWMAFYDPVLSLSLYVNKSPFSSSLHLTFLYVNSATCHSSFL